MADFVVLATADWDHPLWTNKQHTALSLVETDTEFSTSNPLACVLLGPAHPMG